MGLLDCKRRTKTEGPRGTSVLVHFAFRSNFFFIAISTIATLLFIGFLLYHHFEREFVFTSACSSVSSSYLLNFTQILHSILAYFELEFIF